MNQYDSSKIEDILSIHGYISIKNPEEADILILNTCSIREKAQEKLFHQLGRWRKLKIKRKNIIIGVGGCVASQEGMNIYKRASYIDIIFGPQTFHRLPKMIDYVLNIDTPIIDISFPNIEKFNDVYNPTATGPVALVSIMEGCNKYCSFCIVPYTRGKEFSRSPNDILLEIKKLSKKGVREINLLGQNVNAYRSTNYDGSICTFAKLLKLVSFINGIDRIRYITSHPMEFTDDIIELYRNTPKLVNFLHLPVQSGSDRILKKMKRMYTILEYKEIINKLRNTRNNIQISSDFIVGFPGETQKDFEQTMQLITDINFDMSFSFIYSARPNTPASKMLDNLSISDKKKRLYILQKRISYQAMQFSRKMHGTVQSVLVEKSEKNNIMNLSGRTENNRIVYFKGNSSMIGKFIDVKIIDVSPYSLRGACT